MSDDREAVTLLANRCEKLETRLQRKETTMTELQNLKTPRQLLDALTRNAQKGPTENELLEQRVAFILGSVDPSNNVTREQIRKVLAGSACKEEQSYGAGPCGICQRCLRAVLEQERRRAERAEAALRSVRSSLPPDPNLDCPWSKAIAIIDETLANTETEDK